MASAYVGEPIDDMIGQHGKFSFWIFGNPYSLGGWVKLGESLDRCCSVVYYVYLLNNKLEFGYSNVVMKLYAIIKLLLCFGI